MISLSSRPTLRRAILPAAFVVAFLTLDSTHLNAQNDSLERTLLWRIEGNGLEQPSYLYGTFHTQKPVAFDFGDSVLPALLSCRTAAFELHVDSMSSEVFRHLFQPDSVIDLQEVMSEEEFAQLNDRLIAEVGLPAEFFRYTDPSFLLLLLDDMNVEELEPEDLEGLKDLFREDFTVGGFDKETFLDAWLFQTARLEGKKVVGLETLAEQIAVSDTIPLQERIRMLTEVVDIDPVEMGKEWNRLVDAYKDGDLNEMLRLFDEAEMAPGLYFKLLTERNRNMAERIAALMPSGSVFTAVGAAHLPGAEGLIALLRKKGYRVVPVISEKNGALRTYKRPKRELEWYETVDPKEGLRFRTPIPPVDYPLEYVDGESAELRRRFAADISTGLYYLIVEEEISLESLLAGDLYSQVRERWFGGYGNDLFASVFSTESRLAREKEIETNGVKGREFSGVDGNGDLTRLRTYQRGNKLYSFVSFGGIGMMSSRDDTRFMESVRLDPLPSSEWETVQSDFRVISMPSGVVHNTVEEWRGGYQFYTSTERISSIDPATGIWYAFEFYSIPPWTMPRIDSSLVSEMLYSGFSPERVLNEEMIDLGTQGWDGEVRFNREYRLELDSGVVVTRRIRLGGPDVTALTVVEPPGVDNPEDRQRFFAGEAEYAEMTDPNPESYRRSYPDENFSVILREPLNDSSDYYAYTGRNRFQVGEWWGNASRLAVCETFLPYFTAESEDAFFEEFRENLKTYDDTIVAEKIVESGGLRWHDYTVAMGYTDRPGSVYRERAALHGGRLYRLRWFPLDPQKDPATADEFFNTFGLLRPQPEGDIFTRKTELLLRHLSSPDSATREHAVSFLGYYSFLEEERDLVRKALGRTYPDDTDSVSRTIEGLLYAFDIGLGDEDIKFLKDFYQKLPSYHESRSTVLGILVRHRSPESLRIVGGFLAEDPPEVAYPWNVFGDFYENMEGIEFLYPEMLELVGDEDWQDYIVGITNLALDSGRVTPADLGPGIERLQRVGGDLLDRYRKPNMLFSDGEEVWPWSVDQMITLLGKLPPDEEVDRRLERALRDTNMNVKRGAVIALLRHGRPVADRWLEQTAADRGERINLWRGLEEAGMIERFPEEYRSQVYFAEGLIFSELYNYEENPDEMEYVADRVIEWNGEKMRGYLFRWRYVWDDEETPWSIAFCVQPEDPDQIGLDGSSVRFIWESGWETVDEQFRALMQQEWETEEWE